MSSSHTGLLSAAGTQLILFPLTSRRPLDIANLGWVGASLLLPSEKMNPSFVQMYGPDMEGSPLILLVHHSPHPVHQQILLALRSEWSHFVHFSHCCHLAQVPLTSHMNNCYQPA